MKAELRAEFEVKLQLKADHEETHAFINTQVHELKTRMSFSAPLPPVISSPKLSDPFPVLAKAKDQAQALVNSIAVRRVFSPIPAQPTSPTASSAPATTLSAAVVDQPTSEHADRKVDESGMCSCIC